MGLFQRLAGVVGNFFQVGGPAGPAIKNNGGVLEARDAADLAYINIRGADPVGNNDLTTKQYVDKLSKPVPVSLQFNGGAAIPLNSVTERYYVVTTTGINAAIGELLWDNGLNDGNPVQTIPASSGQEIVTTAAFIGGTITFTSNQNYVWDAGAGAWGNISPNVSGAVFCIKFALPAGPGTTPSVTAIPATATVLQCSVDVTTPYAPGTTLTVGKTGGGASVLQGTGDNFMTVADLYDAEQITGWGAGAATVSAVVAGAGAVGAASVTVVYSLPNL